MLGKMPKEPIPYVSVRGELGIPKSVPPLLPSFFPLMQWVVLDVNFQETCTKGEEGGNGRATGHEYVS